MLTQQSVTVSDVQFSVSIRGNRIFNIRNAPTTTWFGDRLDQVFQYWTILKLAAASQSKSPGLQDGRLKDFPTSSRPSCPKHLVPYQNFPRAISVGLNNDPGLENERNFHVDPKMRLYNELQAKVDSRHYPEHLVGTWGPELMLTLSIIREAYFVRSRLSCRPLPVDGFGQTCISKQMLLVDPLVLTLDT